MDEYLAVDKKYIEDDQKVKEKTLEQILDRGFDVHPEQPPTVDKDTKVFEGQGRTQFCSLIQVPLYKDGVFSYEHGAKYPMKGYMYSEVCDTAHLVKRLIRIGLEVALYPMFAPFILLISLTPWKYRFIAFLIDKFVFWAHTALKPYYVYPHRLCRSGRELYTKGIAYYVQIRGKNVETMRLFVRIMCMIWEYDNSYRYRGQDLFGVLSASRLQKHPLKEILRVWDVGIRREYDGRATNEGTYHKRKLFRKGIIALRFLYPKIFKGIVEYLLTLDRAELALDEEDQYDCARRVTYYFNGVSDTERLKRRILFDRQSQATVTGTLVPRKKHGNTYST